MEKIKKHWRLGVAVLLAFALGWFFPKCGEGCEPAEVAEEIRFFLPQDNLALEAPASQPAPREPEPLRLLDPLGDDDAGDDTGRVIWTAEDGFVDDDAEEASEPPPPPPRSAGSEAENVSSGVQVSEGEKPDDNLSGEEEAKAEKAVPIPPEPAPPKKRIRRWHGKANPRMMFLRPSKVPVVNGEEHEDRSFDNVGGATWLLRFRGKAKEELLRVEKEIEEETKEQVEELPPK